MKNLIIHRGTQEIGGSAVEIKNKNTRLLFDFGIPLEFMKKDDYSLEDYKLDIKGLYKDDEPEFDAVFLTHAHPDHYGLIELINPQIPIYVSKITYDILTKITPLLPKQSERIFNLKIIDEDVVFEDIIVKSHSVNHSVAGACAYEILVDNKTIVYTGDIRFHGRTSTRSCALVDKIKSPDYLIMEGTTIGRKEQTVMTEFDLESKFIEIFNGDKLPIVQFSPQNLDRFVTVYKACLKSKKTLVIDPYTCYVLDVYSQISKHIPQFSWNNIQVYFANTPVSVKLAETKKLYRYKSKKIDINTIVKNPEKYVIKANGVINSKIFEKINKDKVIMIFSMWRGYLYKSAEFDDYEDIIVPLHTSGHAYVSDLQKLVERMNPQNVIPIHTEYKEQFAKLFTANIIELDDGQNLSF